MNTHRRNLSLNERRLIELVFRSGSIARIDLTRATDMTGASVTRLVAGLEEMGLFQQTSEKSGARGQPKRLLSLKRDGFRSVGIYLYLDRLAGVLIDFTGRIIAQEDAKLIDSSAEGIISAAKSLSDRLVRTTKTKPAQFLGIGFSVPGNFGTYGLVRAHEAFAELEGYGAGRSATEDGESRLHLENDGTAAALGEYLFGRNETRDPLFLIHIGYGLGGGAVLDGKPYRGFRGNACLPGSLFPYGKPRPTLQDLEETLQEAGISIEQLRKLPAKDILEQKVVSQWISRASDQLRLAVRVISGMFDPELIVLGGAMPVQITDALADALNKTPIEGPSRGLNCAPVSATGLGELNGPIGAASIPFFRTFFPGSSVERGNAYLNGRSLKPD